VPVVRAHGAAQALSATAAGLVAHQLIDNSSRDAGVLQPGGERVAEVMGAVEVDGVQERVAWGWERRPATDLPFVGWSDQAGCGELIERALDGGQPDRAALLGEPGGELLDGLAAVYPQCLG
jgi:hypothetical protein